VRYLRGKTEIILSGSISDILLGIEVSKGQPLMSRDAEVGRDTFVTDTPLGSDFTTPVRLNWKQFDSQGKFQLANGIRYAMRQVRTQVPVTQKMV
jgi:hypothetical protein